LRFGQFGVIRFPVGVSVLGDHVVNVVNLGTKEKMSDVSTLPVVAPMQAFHARRNRAVLAFPHHPMDFGGSVDDLDDAVSTRVQKAGPLKAAVRGSLVLRFQPMFKRSSTITQRDASTRNTAKPTDIPRARFKGYLADFAVLHGDMIREWCP
jgi:hypothetical protein